MYVRDRMKTALAVLAIATSLLVGGCDVAKSALDIKSRGDAAAAELSRELGTPVQFGFNWNNGVLEVATFAFEAEKVPHLTVGDLESRVRKAVEKHLETPPRRIAVTLLYSKK